ncbi:MAG: Wzz/FepE/Etk N-terminal domain-containing protein [Chloroflexota bacterium]|nr:Wzz/FepE/Etk N-terminal domain-containing protein [Chloroflexota bacterium]
MDLSTGDGRTSGLGEYARMLRRWWWLLVVLPLLAALAAYWLSTLQPPSYRATALLLIRPQAGSSADPNPADISAINLVTRTYGELATSPPVLRRVSDRLGLSQPVAELSDRLQVDVQSGSHLIRLTAEGADPANAARLANATAEEFSAVVSDRRTAAPYPVSIFSPAEPPQEPSGLSPLYYAALALLAGLGGAVACVALVERFAPRLRSGEDVYRETSPPVLATLPRLTRGPQAVDALVSPQTPVGEASQLLRTRLELATGGKGAGVVTVVGTEPDEVGKSPLAAGLALALAQAGQRVVFVDGALTRPRTQRVFDSPNARGLSDLLRVAAPNAETVLVAGPHPNLMLLPAGQAAPGASGSMTRNRVEEIVGYLREIANVVVIDGPSGPVTSDTLILSSVADHALIVAALGSTRPDRLSAAVEEISATGAHVLGVVLSGADSRGSR